ncbi:NADH dehydrogenase subunit M [Longilinea arvoryzae]|uniref:NADH dehydrogenase subunit M n=1 Tax=Longilinea arvoryzae TaxID=360412 RepID=A0A0S7BBS3_9CHLR|nr:NADH-quinone oxidoreductase subunit M [Longilinea arvoryzae]GAP15276.1 NADH dehydrogenase subunit M [Longilinea arvoryzae]
MQFPILSVLIFLPVLTGILLLFLPAGRKNLIKGISLGTASLVLLLAVFVYIRYDVAAGGYQLIEQAAWVPALGISYHVGVDGIGVPMVLLAGLVLFTGVLVSWGVEDRPREFFAFMMLLGASVLGVFCSLDLFMLFFFFELAVFPKYLMIVLWGYPKTRNYGGMKLTLYLFVGSMIALVGALAIYFGSGMRTFDMIALENAGFTVAFQRLWFPFVFLGFGILSGIFPFHSWAPDGHVAAPTAISMLLAGVEMKVGAFAALRVAFMLLPEGARFWSTAIMILATINVVYGALIALIQTDFKYVIGFSSVSHMGLVLIGFATLNRQGLIGAGMQMFSHGVMTALFFSVVGMVYDRAHTREISQLGGLVRKMPIAAVGFIIGGLVSMGMPGFSGFVAEFPIFMGVWQVQPIVAVIAILGVLITAAYILLVVRRVFFGELPEALANVGDITLKDKLSTVLLAVIMIALGIFPSLMAPMISSGVDHILALLGGA